jgi:hypothetical protein
LWSTQHSTLTLISHYNHFVLFWRRCNKYITWNGLHTSSLKQYIIFKRSFRKTNSVHNFCVTHWTFLVPSLFPPIPQYRRRSKYNLGMA